MVKETTPNSEQVTTTDAASKEVVAALLDLLRRANREVKLTSELDGKAKDALDNYQRIASDLAVRENPGEDVHDQNIRTSGRV